MRCKSSVSVIVPAALPKTKISTGHTVVNWDFEIDLQFADGSQFERVSSVHAELARPRFETHVLERTFRGMTFRRQFLDSSLPEYAQQQLAVLDVDDSVDVVLVSDATFWVATTCCQFKKLSRVPRMELESRIQSISVSSGDSK